MLAMRNQTLNRFVFRRLASGKPARSLSPPAKTHLYICTDDEETGRVAFSGWKQLMASNRFAMIANPLITASGAEPQPHIVHLIGTAEQTNSGIRFKVARQQTVSEKMATRPDAAEASARYFRAEDLATRFPALQIAVLQGEFTSQEVERRETDRTNAAVTRIFAASLFAEGIPIVIVIPPLEGSVTEAVIATVAGVVLKRRRWPVQSMLKALASARKHVQESEFYQGEDGMEWALDISIYAPTFPNPLNEKISTRREN